METIYQKQYIPWELLQVGCNITTAGETVRTLAVSWVNNTTCLEAHQTLVEGLIRNYTEKGIEDANRKGE